MQIETFDNSVLQDGTPVARVDMIQFATEAEAQDAYNLLVDHIVSGNNGPLEFPNGQQVHLLPHEKWLLDSLMRINLMLLVVMGRLWS